MALPSLLFLSVFENGEWVFSHIPSESPLSIVKQDRHALTEIVSCQLPLIPDHSITKVNLLSLETIAEFYPFLDFQNALLIPISEISMKLSNRFYLALAHQLHSSIHVFNVLFTTLEQDYINHQAFSTEMILPFEYRDVFLMK